MIIVTERPHVFIKGTTKIIRWNSVHHPMIYKLRRQDYFVSSILPGVGGNATITLFVPSDIVIGKQIYVSSLGGVFTVTDVITGGPGDVIVIDKIISGPILTGYVNNLGRDDYHILVHIYLYNALTGLTTKETSRWVSRNDGTLDVDIHEFCTANLELKDVFLYNVRNTNDKRVWGKCSIAYQEYYTGALTDEVPDDETTFFTKSVKYIQEKYGQNLAEYVPVDEDVILGGVFHRAKFLTPFSRPTYFLGYPWDIDFIISDYIQSGIGTSEEEAYDVNGLNVLSQDSNLIFTGIPGENRLTLKGSYPATTDLIKLWLEIGGFSSERYVDQNYVDDDYDDAIPPVDITITPFRFTEEKYIKVRTACANPVYLEWRGPVGGWPKWCFQRFQEVTVEGDTTGVFSVEGNDLELMDSRVEELQKTRMKEMLLGAYIETEDFSGLETILDSPVVNILVSQSPIKWMRVRVKPGSFKYQTRKLMTEINFVIQFPEYYTIPQ